MVNKLQLNESLVSEFEKQTQEVIQFNQTDQANYFVKNIWVDVLANKALSKDKPELFTRMEELYKINSLLLMSKLKDEEFVHLFEDGLELYFSNMVFNIDIWDLIKGKLVTIYDLVERDALKKRARKAMLNNKSLLTKEKIARNGKKYQPTIRQWLLDFTSATDVGEVGNVKINEYFVQNKNYQKLSEDDQYRVRVLIMNYERLKKSSSTAEGLEETVGIDEDGKITIFSEGRMEDLDSRIVKLLKKLKINKAEGPGAFLAAKEVSTGQSAVEAEVLAAYQGDKKLQKAIAKEIKKLDKKFGSDKEGLRTEFFQTTQKGNINRTVGALMLMTQNDDLLDFISEDPKLNKFLTAIWEKQYGADLVADFKINPTDVKYVKMFLQYVLEQRLHIDEDDAARVGLQIGNAFAGLGKKSYNKMAYFDVVSKEFHWFE